MSQNLEINLTPEAGDLVTCEQEPIHIPGSIQPHGVLLSLEEPSLKILQASENATALFGCELSSLLGSPFHNFCSAEYAAALEESLRSPLLEKNPLYVGSINVMRPAADASSYRAIAHRHRGALLLELEEASTSEPVSFQSVYPPVANFLSRLLEVSTLAELSQLAAEEIRRVTGFDRVLVYRFDPEWHGHVIAESRDEALTSYLDLWFPASDIPAQARELYRLNRLRLIADATYKPVPLLPILDPRTEAPLDLSYATLRSVSPVHIEYLKNMGITASMSISVIRDGQLWGLISLHHKSARVAPFEVRLACDLLGQAFSTQMAARESQIEYEHRLHLKSISTRLLGYMAQEERFIDGLISHPDDLLAFAQAAGAAVLFEGRCTLLGVTPQEEDVWRLADWIASQEEQEVFRTNSLSLTMPDSEGLRDAASGVLAISISKLYRSYVLWFRPEVVKTVKWSGDPRKPLESDEKGVMRLHPRKSFEIWKETVRGRSEPWRNSEIESAAELRNAVVGIVLRKAEELASLSAELQRSNKELEAFSYSVSHDLRAPFRHISGYTELLRDHLVSAIDDTSKRYLSTIEKAAESAGILVDNLLNFSRIGRSQLHLVTVDMGQLIEEVRAEFRLDEKDRFVEWSVAPLPAVQGDAVLLRVVWQNLFSNALKFTRSRSEVHIAVGCEEQEREVIFSIQDNGVGFDQRYVNKLFGVFQRLHSQEDFEGTGIGLANVRRSVGRHGGRTWAKGEVGQGSTFYFSLPRRIYLEKSGDA